MTDRIVIGGGDGTICNALPHLLQLDKPLAVLPLGHRYVSRPKVPNRAVVERT